MDDPRIQPYLEHLKREEGCPPFTGAGRKEAKDWVEANFRGV